MFIPFCNISDIFVSEVVCGSWQPVVLMYETGVPCENNWPAASYWQTLSHNVVSRIPCH
jgi:hypothetical protein